MNEELAQQIIRDAAVTLLNLGILPEGKQEELTSALGLTVSS